MEHIAHRLYLFGIPAIEWLVERSCSLKHIVHILYVTGIPATHTAVGVYQSRAFVERISHIFHVEQVRPIGSRYVEIGATVKRIIE